ncbi:MAG: hypothetical protein F4123_00315 [Gemmatimonadetes bacterium]|nr:hypothetical protein [Gemmatimonadota bacterium]MYB97034.1 hypothetical protein [Gemmatimonadota bacterium]MYI44838.1 hypothetical protein [Gemmatimonadota bacterium]
MTIWKRHFGPRHSRLAAVAALLALGTGCATYHDARVQDLPPQQQVRMRLAPDELARNVAFVSGNEGLVNARFVDLAGDSATFLLTTPTSHRQVNLHLASILSVERKEASHGRSMLLSAGLVAAVATLAYLGFEGDTNTGPNPDEDLTDQFTPMMRFSIPFKW